MPIRLSSRRQLRGWRDMAREILIIVVGILIALWASHVAEQWSWERRVVEAESQLAAESANNFLYVAEAVTVMPCIQRQLEQLRDLHRHGVWADARMLTAVKAADGTAAEATRELAHIRGAQETWLARIGERQATLPVWPELSSEEIEREGARLDGAWSELFGGLAPSDLERQITYRNSRGEQSTSSLADIATHVALHAQYHRGKANVRIVILQQRQDRLGAGRAPRQHPRRILPHPGGRMLQRSLRSREGVSHGSPLARAGRLLE